MKTALLLLVSIALVGCYTRPVWYQAYLDALATTPTTWTVHASEAPEMWRRALSGFPPSLSIAVSTDDLLESSPPENPYEYGLRVTKIAAGDSVTFAVTVNTSIRSWQGLRDTDKERFTRNYTRTQQALAHYMQTARSESDYEREATAAGVR